MTQLSVLDTFEIAAPCDAAWDDMLGDERVRFCGSCEKNVYNLSAMTRQEAIGLIEVLEGKLCARLYRRPDGTVLSEDCPVGLRERARHAARRSVAAAVYLVTVLTVGLVSFLVGRFLAGGEAPTPHETAKAVAVEVTDRIISPVPEDPPVEYYGVTGGAPPPMPNR